MSIKALQSACEEVDKELALVRERYNKHIREAVDAARRKATDEALALYGEKLGQTPYREGVAPLHRRAPPSARLPSEPASQQRLSRWESKGRWTPGLHPTEDRIVDVGYLGEQISGITATPGAGIGEF